MTNPPRNALRVGGAALGVALLAGLSTPAYAAGHDDRTRVLSTVAYSASDAVIPNPERGWYHAFDTHSRADGSGYVPLDEQTLRSYRASGVTQILREWYLEKYATQDTLDPELLAQVQRDFDTARRAGVSVIVRFAYVEGGAWPYSPPYGDAPLSRVLSHIAQLKPLLRANSDVIATVQEGFIGLWGEGYYTDWFASDPADPGTLTQEDWDKRATVLHALLDALPPSRTVQVRTMLMKQKILGVPTGTAGALTPAQAYDGSDLSRVGHHNDCLLASPDDYGTFLSDPLSLDQDYLAADSRYVPVGGETCNVDPPRSEWPSAEAELSRYHYSYLHADYNTDVLDSWGPAALTEVSKKLGYRFVLTQSQVTKNRAQGVKSLSVQMSVRNDGWAAPYNERPARLVLKGRSGTWSVPFTSADGTAVDARSWAPGTTSTASADVCGVPTGTYHAYLDLPSADASLASNPDYAVQTANTGTWQPATGWNDLQQDVHASGLLACSGAAPVKLG
ncbi:uncharacterized protein DUF4874 [Motilibacter rhizosphaerae]|uniref:Uncharacterized protein DUF4874 n=1 Tax=Motilibacter rhizosphaerae TaxID=598652 RepID=A0A4Q7NYY4_9ACTN|nr:DUF4832 domain-containing protein [Motilibacter rhizosphaerae]RZS91622.1 uncharacterized protein DUF4874 [Motilibacter rhizosphaerae]